MLGIPIIIALPLYACVFFLLTTARLKEDSQWFNETHKRRGEQEKRGEKKKKRTIPDGTTDGFVCFRQKQEH